MHHFHSAAGESEGHGPEWSLTSPIGHLIEGGPVNLLSAIALDCASPPLQFLTKSFQMPANSIYVTVEGTYKAYCITPFFPSWLGKGTSLLGFPVTLSGRPSSLDRIAGVAGFEAEEEMAAIDLYGSNAVVGFAVVEWLLAF